MFGSIFRVNSLLLCLMSSQALTAEERIPPPELGQLPSRVSMLQGKRLEKKEPVFLDDEARVPVVQPSIVNSSRSQSAVARLLHDGPTAAASFSLQSGFLSEVISPLPKAFRLGSPLYNEVKWSGTTFAGTEVSGVYPYFYYDPSRGIVIAADYLEKAGGLRGDERYRLIAFTTAMEDQNSGSVLWSMGETKYGSGTDTWVQHTELFRRHRQNVNIFFRCDTNFERGVLKLHAIADGTPTYGIFTNSGIDPLTRLPSKGFTAYLLGKGDKPIKLASGEWSTVVEAITLDAQSSGRPTPKLPLAVMQNRMAGLRAGVAFFLPVAGTVVGRGVADAVTDDEKIIDFSGLACNWVASILAVKIGPTAPGLPGPLLTGTAGFLPSFLAVDIAAKNRKAEEIRKAFGPDGDKALARATGITAVEGSVMGDLYEWFYYDLLGW